MANALDITLRALTSATSGSSTGVDLETGRSAAELLLRATDVSGNLTVAVQTSADNSTGWRTARTFNTVNAPTVQRIAVDGLDQYARLSLTVGGSATLSVVGTAHQLYAEPYDLTGKLSREVLEKIEQEDSSLRAHKLIDASGEMESALAVHYSLPLTAIPAIIRSKTADIAAFQLLARIGFVGGGVDELVTRAYDEAMEWLGLVRKRQVLPFGALPDPEAADHASDPDTLAELPTMAPKGWTSWGDFG